MADGSDRLACIGKLVDQGVRVLVVGEIEHGAVATGVEKGVELAGAADEGGQLLGVLPQRGFCVEELGGDWVGLEHLDGAGVEGRFTAGRGGDDEFGVGSEDVVRMSELGL